MSRPVALLLSLLFAFACGDDADRPSASDGGGDNDAPDTAIDTSTDSATEAEVALPPLGLADDVLAGRVVAGVATAPEHLVQGPKAEGMLGDLVLANQRARFVVEGARRAGGYRMWGGHLVDVAIDGRPDRYGELWLAWNLEAFVPREASVVSDGRDGVAHVRLVGTTERYPWPDSFLRDVLRPPPAALGVTYDYRLEPDNARLELEITLVNPGASEVDVAFPLIAMNMGDGARSYAPGGGFGALQQSREIAWFGAIGLESSYAIASTTLLSGVFSYASMDIVQQPTFSIAPGGEHQIAYGLIASSNGTAGIEEWTGGAATAVVSGAVAGPSDGGWVALTGVIGGVGAVVPIREGRFRARVWRGPWSVQAFAPGVAPSPAVSVGVTDFSEATADLALPEPATLRVTVRDAATEAAIPAQLTLFRDSGTTSPFAPANVRLDRDHGASRSVLAFVVAPDSAVRVPAGRYSAVASRGYSYELARTELELTAGEQRALTLELVRAVDTSGWSAADLHLHAQWSSDSDVPLDARVRQAAANDVALPVLTEHAYVGDLLSAAELAGVSDWVAVIAAQEVTTFEYGHFNAFPLVYDPDAPSGGAVFEHGRPGAELFAAMRAQRPGQMLIQVNHPRSGAAIFGYFNYVELDTTTGVAARPERMSTDWELLEVFNGRCLPSGQNELALRDWVNLTNLGWKKTLSSGSDSHSEGSGVGHPRSWVAVESGAVALDPDAIIAPLVARATFVSCGPFVRFAAADGTPIGGLTAVDGDGAVSFAVSVEAPTWIGVDEVRLLENGVVIDARPLADPHRGPARPALRFEGVMSARPERDAWYVVEVLGSGSLSPVDMGDGPYALTNPIEVDSDHDGVWSAPGAPAGGARR